jgi:hypothetical protein
MLKEILVRLMIAVGLIAFTVVRGLMSVLHRSLDDR